MANKYFAVRSGATALRNETVHDKGLSFTALGLLTVMLSMPPNAPMGYRQFLGRGIGQAAILNAMKELEVAGYRWRFSTRNSSGLIRQTVIVFDVPTSEEKARATLTSLGTTPETCVSQPMKVIAEAPIDIDELCDAIDSLSGGDSEHAERIKKSAVKLAERDNKQRERDLRARGKHDLIAQEQAARRDKTPLRENPRKGKNIETEEKTTVRENPRKGEKPPLREFPMHGETVARSADAQLISKDINSKKDKSFLTSQQEQDEKQEPASNGTGEGRKEIYLALTEEQISTIYECLPKHIKITDIRGLIKIWPEIKKLLDAGWQPGEVRDHLDSKPLPAQVIYLPALIASRLKDMLPTPPRVIVTGKKTRGHCEYHNHDYDGICIFCESERKAGQHQGKELSQWLKTGCKESVALYKQLQNQEKRAV